LRNFADFEPQLYEGAIGGSDDDAGAVELLEALGLDIETVLANVHCRERVGAGVRGKGSLVAPGAFGMQDDHGSGHDGSGGVEDLSGQRPDAGLRPEIE
jgi:hypothetical protein